MKKIVGIIGGMGPLATCDLFRKIIFLTDAKCDQEHIHIIIDNNTNIPDRTMAILNKGKDPVPEIVKSGLRLESMGADVIVMACNTAHYFYDRITSYINVPVINMLHETSEEASNRGIKKVGLLATNGTIASGIYNKEFAKNGIAVINPSIENQVFVMDLIYNGIKASNTNINLTGFYNTIDDLFSKGAEIIVLGCTEFPVVFKKFHIEKPYLDPTSILASSVIKFINANDNKQPRKKLNVAES